jgi:hypothetical protein
MYKEPKPFRWKVIRWIGFHLAVAGTGGVAAMNMAYEIPQPLMMPLTIGCLVFGGVGWGLLFVARRFGGYPLPRWWSDSNPR